MPRLGIHLRTATWVAIAIVSLIASPGLAVELWVAANGSDEGTGSRSQPMASLRMALRRARELRRLKDPSISDGVQIILRGGDYRLSEPVRIRPEDSGTDEQPTVIRAAEGERPRISGGVVIQDWMLVSEFPTALPKIAQGNVWVANVPTFNGQPLDFRQLWIQSHKAIRAREPNENAMHRLVDWDRKHEKATISSSVVSPTNEAASPIEMVVLQMWEIAVLRIKTMEQGDGTQVTFHDPESRIEFEHPWPQPIMEPKGAPYFLTNSIQFLDAPGEWYHDREQRKLYYWPRANENLEDAEVIVPALENLVRIEGTVDRPVSHVAINGIHFQHTTWLRPSQKGHVPLQATMYLLDAYKLRPKGTPEWRSLDNQAWIGRPPSAVTASGVAHLEFRGCQFQHLAATGLDFVAGTHHDTIEGCLFRDIGGNGIQLGCFQESGTETHLPYNPQDQREVCQHERIANNLVTDCANEDWGGVGICVGYARDVTIEHNELSNLSYTGISLGWGWTRTPNVMRRNRVTANYIHHIARRMADTAGVYTLSAQPWTVIRENVVEDIQMSPYVHDADHWFYYYLDEGSSFITSARQLVSFQEVLSQREWPRKRLGKQRSGSCGGNQGTSRIATRIPAVEIAAFAKIGRRRRIWITSMPSVVRNTVGFG